MASVKKKKRGIIIWNTWFISVFREMWKKKTNCILVQALRVCIDRTAHRGSRGITLLFLDHGTRIGWGFSVTARLLFTPGKTRYPLCGKLGGPQDRSRQVRKISLTSGFDPLTVLPVARRYTDWATRPTIFVKRITNLKSKRNTGGNPCHCTDLHNTNSCSVELRGAFYTTCHLNQWRRIGSLVRSQLTTMTDE